MKYHDIVDNKTGSLTINSLINYKDGTYRGVTLTIEISKLTFPSGNLFCFKINYQYHFGDIAQKIDFVYTTKEKSNFDESILFLRNQISKTLKKNI